MCAPGSKDRLRREQRLRVVLLCAAFAWAGYLAAQSFVAYEVALVVQAEGDYLMSGVIPWYAPSKLRMSAAAADEVDNLQHYVRLLAQHDLTGGATWNNTRGPFVEAAFDRASNVPGLARSGVRDLAAFLSPAQQHAHALLPQAPLAWGYLLQVNLATLPAEPAPACFTIWLTTPLRGGVAKKREAGGGGGGGGDNGTDPTASSSAAPPPKKRPAAALSCAVAGRRAAAMTSRPTSADSPSKKKPAAASRLSGKR